MDGDRADFALGGQIEVDLVGHVELGRNRLGEFGFADICKQKRSGLQMQVEWNCVHVDSAIAGDWAGLSGQLDVLRIAERRQLQREIERRSETEIVDVEIDLGKSHRGPSGLCVFHLALRNGEVMNLKCAKR